MRHLIDAHHLGAHQTGNETWIRNISRELAGLAEPGELAFATGAAGHETVRRLTGQTALPVSTSAVRRLAVDLPRLARLAAADSVLVQYTMPPRSPAPYVVMVHDTSFEDAEARHWLPRRTATRIRWSVRDSARRAAHLLAPSEFTRRSLLGLYGLPPEQVSVTPNAVDPDLADRIDRATPPPADRTGFRVVVVGNVLPRKNIAVVAQAVAALRRSGIDADLRVVGSVPQAGRAIEQQIRQLLGPAATFTGYVDDDRLAAEYRAGDVLAFPSLFEGFGIPAVEAMYAGVPVVVSDRASLPEVVGSAGLVVPARDPAAWTAALRSLQSDPSRRAELAGLGRRRADDFSWRSSAQTVLDVLRTTAERRGR